MPLSDIVTINITTATAGVSQLGFGTPLILSASAAWAERTRTYTSLAAVTTDFAVGLVENQAAAAIFSQNPSPPSIMIGRCANKPSMIYDVTPVVTDLTPYTLLINGNSFSFTSGVGTTNTLIVNGLIAAIGAAAYVTATNVANVLHLVAVGAAGTFMTVQAVDTTKQSVKQNTVDAGVAADLAAISLENNNWYGLVGLYASSAIITAIAAYVEANQKLFVAQSQDGDILTAATSDIATTLKTAAYTRTALIFHPQTNAFSDAALLGKCLPFAPGSETWKFKTLAGVAAVTLTGTQQANILAKNCGYYYTVAGINITAEGKVTSGEFIDVIRGRDWFQNRLQTRIFGVLANAAKVPYTDAGIAIIEAQVRAQLIEGIQVGFLTNNPAPVVQVPTAASAAGADRIARLLRNVTFTANIAGAIHATILTGVISV